MWGLCRGLHGAPRVQSWCVFDVNDGGDDSSSSATPAVVVDEMMMMMVFSPFYARNHLCFTRHVGQYHGTADPVPNLQSQGLWQTQLPHSLSHVLLLGSSSVVVMGWPFMSVCDVLVSFPPRVSVLPCAAGGGGEGDWRPNRGPHTARDSVPPGPIRPPSRQVTAWAPILVTSNVLTL